MRNVRDITVSRREQQVLDALAERRTNAEIAERLFLSVRTVETHVSALLRKFDAANRRALMEIVQQHPPQTTEIHGRVRRLPLALNSFIGRTVELAAVTNGLAQSRLVTITGPAGVGKTRLAVEAARTALHLDPDEVTFADLAPAVDTPAAVAAIGLAVGLNDEPTRLLRDALSNRLRLAPMILVLDNCEHLVDDLADVVAELLDATEDLRILATSREAFALPGELVISLGPLATPDLDVDSPRMIMANEAVLLFADRAAAVCAGFVVDPDSAPAVASICRRLDGIPLALELAAAQLPALTPQQIDTRLRDRFQLLRAPARGRANRHQTLSSAVAWSYELLDARERALLDRLSVFRGTFSLEAAEAVTVGPPIDPDDVVVLLVRLVRKSLVVTETVADENRFRLLETIREFGGQRLATAGELESWRSRHHRWAFGRMREAASALSCAVVPEWLNALDDDLDNIEAALSWSMITPERAAEALTVVRGLESYWMARGVRRQHGVRWLTAAADRATTVGTAARVEALLGAVLLVMWSDLEAARVLAAKAAHLAEASDDPHAQGYAALACAWGHIFGGATDLAEPLVTRAAALIDVNDPIHPWTAAARALLQGLSGDHKGAAATMRLVAAESRSHDDAHLAGAWLSCAAHFALASGDVEQARVDVAVGIDEARVADCASCESLALSALSLLEDDPATRLSTARKALRLAYDIGEVWGVLGGLEVTVGALADAGAVEDAALLAAATRALLSTAEFVETLPARAFALAHAQVVAQASLDAEAYSSFTLEGQRMDYRSVVAHALR